MRGKVSGRWWFTDDLRWHKLVNFYECVVVEYLRADRSAFVNTESCIQLNEADNPDTSGPHWYCDAIAIDFRQKVVYLCEISYSRPLQALLKRLSYWHESWTLLRLALQRDSSLPADWPVRPWLFVPEELLPMLVKGLERISGSNPLAFTPRVTPLEMVQLWRYRSWSRVGEAEKATTVPEAMRI